MVVIRKPNYKNSSIDNRKLSVNFTAKFSALLMVVLVSGLISLAAVAPASAVDVSKMDAVFSDSFDDLNNWKNPQENWGYGPSPSNWGTDSVAYISLNKPHTIGKNRPQNLITNTSKPIDLTGYQTVILEFDSNAKSTKKGNQKENVIVTDAKGVQHIVWAKSKATFTGLQQIDISNYVAGNNSINLTFQYVKKGPASDSWWEIDDLKVLGCTTAVKPYNTVEFNKTSYTVLEGEGVFAELNITFTPSSQVTNQGPVTVNWTARDGTAYAGTNYGDKGDNYDVDVNGSVTFTVGGPTYQLIYVPILDDHQYNFPYLSFNVSIEDIKDETGNTISGSPSDVEVTIIDSDSAEAPEVMMPTDAQVDEGSTWSGSGSFVERGDGSHWTATVNYGDGDGDEPLPLADDKTFTLSHTYDDDKIYTVTVTVTNDKESLGSDTCLVTVSNVAPTVNAGADATIDEGSTFSGSCSFTDPGADMWTARMDYGDGSEAEYLTLTSKTFSLSHVYADDGEYTVTVIVTDDDLGVGSDTLKVTVNNVAPTPTLSGTGSVDEGATYTLTLGSGDSGAYTISSWTINWGDVTENIDGNPGSVNHVYADGPNNYRISATAMDKGITYDAGNTVDVTVNNVAPTANAGLDQTVNEGDSVSFSGSATDPGALDTFTYSWDFGDGSPVGSGATSTHVYADNGTFDVTLTVTDKDGGVGTDSCIITVNNVAPTLTLSGASSVDEGATYTLTLSSSDPGADTISSWSIDWGDGNVETVSGDPTSATHVYATPDDYKISATATDEDGTWAAGNTVDVHVKMAFATCTIPLVPGWNLISIPVEGSTLWASDLVNDPNLGISMVAVYNPSTGRYSSYMAGDPESMNIQLTVDRGYFLLCDRISSFDVSGSVPDPHYISIVPNWNMIGWGSIDIVKASDIMDRTSDVIMVARFNANIQRYQSYMEGDPESMNFDIKPGEGYFLFSSSAGSQNLYIGGV